MREALQASEAELVEALRAGDEGAFRSVLATNDGPLRRMARLYVAAGLVDDVVQETWIVVIRSIDRFEGRSSLRTWLFGILIRVAHRYRERESRTIPFAPTAGSDERRGEAVALDRLAHPDLGRGYWPASPSWQRDPESGALAAEARQVVLSAIAGLPAAQREVVTLRDVEGWPAAEVCDALGISDVNQRTLLHRGRVAVRAKLEEYLNG